MSLENPAVPLGAADEGEEWIFGGEPSATGVRVTPRKALGLSAVWRAVNLIAGDVGRLPLRVLRVTGSTREEITSHPVSRIIGRKPNRLMTAITWKQTIMHHAIMSGNGYSLILRDPATQTPAELVLIDPAKVKPVVYQGELWYVWYPQSAGKPAAKFRCTEMVHVRGLGFDGVSGYPVCQVLRETFGGAIASRDYGARYYKNSARPGVALEVPAGMKNEAVANLRESWERLHSGVNNAHRVAILRDGVKLQTFSANARDAQLLESVQMSAREIANVIGVPPHKVGDSSRVAYNSLESENQAYLSDTLDRWLVTLEEELEDKLLTEAEKASGAVRIEANRKALLRVNLSSRGTYYTQAISGGWMSRDEVRAEEGYSPIPGGQGAGFVISANVVPVGKSGGDE